MSAGGEGNGVAAVGNFVAPAAPPLESKQTKVVKGIIKTLFAIGGPAHDDDAPGGARVVRDHAGVLEDLELAVKSGREMLVELEGVKKSSFLLPMTVGEILEWAAKPVNWLMDPLILVGGVTLLFAPPKAKKSLFAVALSVALENGAWTAGCFTVNARAHVGYIAYEDGPGRVARRAMQAASQFGGASMPDFYPSDRTPHLPLPGSELALIAFIKERGYKVLVLDVAACCMEVEDENNAADVQRFCASVRRVAVATDCAIILVHHSNKGSKGKSIMQDRARGSSTLMGLADVALELEADPAGGLVLCSLPKDAAPGRWQITYDGDSSTPWKVTMELPDVSTADRLMGALRKLAPAGTPGASIKDLVAELGIGEDTVREAAKAMANAKQIDQVERSGRGGGFLYRLRGVAP